MAGLDVQENGDPARRLEQITIRLDHLIV